MPKDKIPVTPAIRALRQAGVAFTAREYRYEDHGGTQVAARELGVYEHVVVKTLIFQDEAGQPFVVLMHGDMEVSTRNLARITGRRAVSPCDQAAAERYTGYQVGGISPFGVRRAMPVFAEAGILELERLCINGGRRGLLVEMSGADLRRVLDPTPVRAARP